MKEIRFFDPILKKLAYTDCNISILWQGDGYAVSVYVPSEKKFFAFMCVNEQDVLDFKTDVRNFLSEIWPEVEMRAVHRLVCATPDVITVPAAFSASDSTKEMMDFHFKDAFTGTVISQELEHQSITMKAKVPEKPLAQFKKLFKPEHISLHGGKFLMNAMQEAQNVSEHRVYMHVWNGFMEAILTRKSELILYNTFPVNHPNDMVYHILNIFKRYDCDPEKSPLMISGLIEKTDNAIVQLNKFVKHIHFEVQDSNIRFSPYFQELMPHYYFHFLRPDA